MSKLRKAAFIKRWGSDGEQFLTLYGPAGAAQDVTLSDSAVEQIDKGWLQRERDELRAALGRLLSDVEADVASPAAYGFPVEDEQHPYHKSVLAARKALEGVA